MGRRAPSLKGIGDEFTWTLLDAAPDATVLVAGSGEIVFASDHAAELFGCGLDALVGASVEDLVPETLRGVHRAHRTRFQADPTVRSMGQGLSLQARRPDGSEFPVEISLSPIAIGDETFTLAALRDISDRVEAEEHLHRVLQTLDASPDGMLIFDAATLRYSFVNEGAVRLVGYGRDELLAMTPLHLNPQGSRAEYLRIVEELEAHPGRPVVRRSDLLRKDGREVPVEKTFQIAHAGSDGTRWVIVLARDITARLEAEAELQASREALHAAEQAGAIVEDRERIARDLHDTVIQRLFAEGLHLQATAARADDGTRERLQSTIDGLDDTIRELRSSIFTLQTSRAGPGGLRGELLDVIAEATEGLGFEPRLQLEGSIETIDGSIRAHLAPVLREALSNVARHAHASEVRISISAGDAVTIDLTDDGIGIPDEVHGGNGLRNLAGRAEELGGRFSAVALPHGGTRQTWTVPAGTRTEDR